MTPAEAKEQVRREAEQRVLGSMLRDRLIIDDVVMLLRGERCFASFHHQLIFHTIINMHGNAQPIDAVFLGEELHKLGKLADIGGTAYLVELIEKCPSAGNWEHYAGIVKERSLLDSVRSLGSAMERAAEIPTGPVAGIIADYERELSELSDRGISGDVCTLQQAMSEQLIEFDNRKGRKGGSAIPTGYSDLDEVINGLHNSDLVILAARPSVGKTALALNIARQICGHGAAALFVSLEQSKSELAERMICAMGRIDSHRLRSGKFDKTDVERAVDASERMHRYKLFFDDAPIQTIGRICAVTRRTKRRHDIQAVFIDYVQLMEPDDRRENRYQQIGNITRRLKQLAKELKIPVVALAQLNRDADDRRPRLSDLRESGNQEQDADLVMLLHRPASEDSNAVQRIELNIAKQRNGPTQQVVLNYAKAFMRFDNHGPFEAAP